MQCAYCGQPLSPPGAFCGSCGRAQPAPALPERLFYSGPGHAQVERDLTSIVASIAAQPEADHHVWMDGFEDWKPWQALEALAEAVKRAQAKQAEDPAKVARYAQTVEELLGDGSHDAWKLSELEELRRHLGITEETHAELLAQLEASQNTELRVQVDQASMRAFRAEQFCVIQLRLANTGPKAIRSVHVEVATSSTEGLVEQDCAHIAPGSDELVILRLKPQTAGQHEFRALLTTTSFTGSTSHFRTRPLVFAVAPAHRAGGAQVYNMDLSAMQVGKIGNLGVSDGGGAGLGGQADWVAVALSAISETAAEEWRSKHGGAPKGPPAREVTPARPPAPEALPDLFHLGPDGTSEAALPVATVVERILAAPHAVHNVWHDGFSAWKLWSDVPALAALVTAARRKAEDRRALLEREKEAARQEAEQRSALDRLRAERDREVAEIRAQLQRERDQAEQARERAEQEVARARAAAEQQLASVRQPASSGPLTLRLVEVGRKTVSVIKEVRSLTGLGLRDAKNLVNTAPSVILQWEASSEPSVAADAVARLRAAGATVELSGGASASASQSSSSSSGVASGPLTLRLVKVGPKTVSVIKEVRSLSGLGLRDAKNLVNTAPSVILQWEASSEPSVAADAVARLRAVGATVELSGGAPARRPTPPVSASSSASSDGLTLRLLDFGSRKVAVIKAVRAITGLGLKEAKELVERCPTTVKHWADPRWDTPKAEAAAASLREVGARVELSGGSTSSADSGGSPVVLRLLGFGAKKIAVIKEVRFITGLGLKDAKALVERAPSVLKEWDPNADRAQAAQALQSLQQAGARAEVVEGDAGPVLRLLDCGSNKIAAIKAVRAISGLGLKDAKQLVESAPTRVKAWDFSQKRDHFRQWASLLRTAGAQVELNI